MEREKLIKSTAYRLVEPFKIREETIEHYISNGEVVVKPTLISVCHADLRYFTGNRRKEALQQKLPMSLFHEGIGIIEEAMVEGFSKNEKVIVVPNIPNFRIRRIEKSACCPTCRVSKEENYCENGVFMGSGYDGLAQSRLVVPSENVIKIPSDTPDEIAVLTELCSVSVQSIKQIPAIKLKKGNIAVFGDGPVGFLTASILYHLYDVPTNRLIVFGADADRLSKFDFAQQKLVQTFDFKENLDVEVVVECTGGNFSESAINQGIDIINRNGIILLLGVSENKVPINTRDVLEKGLTFKGSSRSSVSDYHTVVKGFKNKDFQHSLRKLIPKRKKEVYTAHNLQTEMQHVSENKSWRKVYFEFVW